MNMYDAPSDRDYADYLNPQEREDEDPENVLPAKEPQPQEPQDDVRCPF